MNDADAAIPAVTRKLLAFTDNWTRCRHAGGPLQRLYLRYALTWCNPGGTNRAGDDGLHEDQIGQAVQRTLGFVSSNLSRRPEWLVEPDLKGANLLGAERTICEALTYRFWIDQPRGWRYTNPNLEQLGLIEAQYLSIENLARVDAEFEATPILRKSSANERASALHALLDFMRKGLAVECDGLDRLKIESLVGQMRSLIKAPTTMAPDP
jgi:hypothetical protein